MKVEEVVARHLASIGTPEAREAVRNRVASGAAQVIFRLPRPGRLDGRGSIISDRRRLCIAMMFAAGDYEGERLVFDGENVNVGQLRLRVRSVLSDFVYLHDVLLKEGLMCGTMTTAWPLLDLATRQPRLSYAGLKKVDRRQLHEVGYRAKRDAGDIQVALYFNPETFRHVYSQYRLAVRAGVGQRSRPSMSDPGMASPSELMDTFYKVEEWFDDFRTVDSLDLPHGYRLRFSREGPAGFLCDYGISLTRVLHNQTLDPEAFVIE
ncbi:MAG: hypothetical protein HXY20_10440 [Acidobacteria bacterium]|nr:hypothetical protein [Acidobacteriota bacterium]